MDPMLYPRFDIGFREHRLIRLTQEQLEAQRVAAQLNSTNMYAPPTTDIRYSTRTAEANAERQEAQRASNLLAGGVSGPTSTTIGPDTTQNYGYTAGYTDLATFQKDLADGKLTNLDSAQRDAALYNLQNPDIAEAARLSNTSTQATSTWMDRLRATAAGSPEAQSILAQAQLAGQPISYNTSTGAVTAVQPAPTTSTLQSAVLRRKNQRQSELDSLKGYDQVPVLDPETGQIIGYKNVENQAKTDALRQGAQNRFAVEDQTALSEKQATMAQTPKSTDTSFNTTSLPTFTNVAADPLAKMQGTLAGVSPELQAAFAPIFATLQNQSAGIDAEVARILGTFQSDQQIEGGFDDAEARAKEVEKRFLDLADRNKQTATEVATYNRDMLEIDKKIIENKAAAVEQEQIKMNIQNEKKLRRQLNALGIQTDTAGLDYLNDQIQSGKDALDNLRQANSLTLLKANLAIGEGYRLDVQKALDNHEASYLSITTQTDDKLDAIKNSIALAKSDRDKEMRSAMLWGAEKKNDLEIKTAETIGQARLAAIEARDRELERGWEREKYGLEKASEGAISELQSIEWTDKFSSRIQDKESVKAFDKIDRALSKMEIAYESGQKGDEALFVLWEKILDENSVVREGEFARVAEQQGYGLSTLEKLKREYRAFTTGEGGQPVSQEVRDAIIGLGREFQQAAKDQAVQDVMPILGQIRTFNNMRGTTAPIDVSSLPFMNRLDMSVGDIDTTLGPIFSENGERMQTSIDDLPPNGSQAQTSVVPGVVWYGSDYWEAGLDISAPQGSPIAMPVDGEVISVVNNFTNGFPNDKTKGMSQNGGWGNQVKIKTADGLTLQFSHLSAANVKKGDAISAGQLFAAVGNTGNTYGATGNHLDLTIYDKDGKPWSAKKVAAFIGTTPLS